MFVIPSVTATAHRRRCTAVISPTSQVKDIPFPKLELDSTSSPVASERQKRKCDHGVIMKVVTTNICGSDQHMVRG